MKMCLKLAHYTFSSSPSKDAMMSTFCVFFPHFLLKFKPFYEFFPFQNVIANLCVCVCVHPLNEDVSQAIIGACFHCVSQKMVVWVALRFVIALSRSLNHLTCDGQCLFLSYCNSCSSCEISFLKCAHCRSPRQKNIYVYIFTRTVRKALNAISDKNET